MLAFEDLDAYKACQELTLAVHQVAQAFEEKDHELSAELWSAALVAPSRIARGSGFRNRKMFWAAADRSYAALSEITYYLNLADGFGLITPEDHHRLESLRGRAAFYTLKLVLELAGVENEGEP
jgi:four helix bundle protein